MVFGARGLRNGQIGLFLTFFYPDCTVGPGVSPDHALVVALVGFTTDRELGARRPHPAPKVILLSSSILPPG